MLFVCIVFISCSNKDKENEKLFEEVNVALSNSNKIISYKTEEYLRKLARDADNVISKEKVAIWQPKAKAIEKLSNDLIAFINSLQENMKSNVNKGLQENDAKILFKELINYQEKILSSDAEINATFKDIVGIVDYKNYSEFIHSTTNANAKIKLAVYINKIETTKEQIIEFCSKHYTTETCGFDVFSVIAVQNSKHFKPNETLEITAGIGSFSKLLQPKIFVNNTPIQLQADATAIYNTQVPAKAGKYSKMVKIEFKKPDGIIGTVEKEIRYTVDE